MTLRKNKIDAYIHAILHHCGDIKLCFWLVCGLHIPRILVEWNAPSGRLAEVHLRVQQLHLDVGPKLKERLKNRNS